MNLINKVCIGAFLLLLPLTCGLAGDAPTSGTLPSGETAAEFLIRQVGGGYAELTTNTQKKKPLQLLMEELVLVDGRKDAKGKWIDDVPDTLPPPLPDIAPRLTTMTLFYDKELANAHWAAFQERYPATSIYLKEQIGRPKITRMPGSELAHWAVMIHERQYCDPPYKDKDAFLRAMGGAVLYADFLYARGGDATRDDAFALLYLIVRCVHSEMIDYKDTDKNRTLEVLITREMFLHTITPALERYKARGVNNTHVCGDSNMNLVFSGVKDYVLLALLHATPAEEHRFMKWYRNHAPREDKGGLLVIQGNDYNRLGDYTGAVICHMASTSANEFQCGKESLVSAIKYLLIREHGQKQGLAYYQRFLEILVSAANPEAKKELAAVKKEIAELDKKAPASNAQQPHKMGEKK